MRRSRRYGAELALGGLSLVAVAVTALVIGEAPAPAPALAAPDTRPFVHAVPAPGVPPPHRAPRRLLETAPRPTLSKSAPAATHTPFEAVLATGANDGVAYFDVNVIRDTAVGEAILDCLGESELRDIEMLQEKLGVNVVEAVDRVAVTEGETAVISGDFAGGRWAALDEDLTGRPYGDAAVLYAPPEPGSSTEVFAVWNDELLITGRGVAAVEAAVDRIDGRAPLGASALPPDARDGEISGRGPATGLLDVLPLPWESRRALLELLRAANLTAEYDLYIDRDVRVAVRLSGADPDAVRLAEEGLTAALEILREGPPSTDGRAALRGVLGGAHLERNGADLELGFTVPIEAVRAIVGRCGADRCNGVLQQRAR